MPRPSPIVLPTSFSPRPCRERIFARATRTKFDVQAADGGTTILIYDEISPFGVTPKMIRDALAQAKGKVTVRINSPGGLAFDGITIFNDLVAHPKPVRVEIVGLAASAASVVAMAGDTRAIAANAHLMIHNAWGLTVGDRHDHEAQAELLKSLDTAMAETYADRAGHKTSEIVQMMDEESWFNANRAIELGFATEKIGDAKPAARFDLSAYSNAPAELSWMPSRADPLPFESEEELQLLLRNRAGLPQRAAARLARAGWPAISRTDDPDIDKLAARIAVATAELTS